MNDPLWYKDAIIYQLHVRTFYDSNNDSIGDFMGLTQKLDYLVDLGVTAISLFPFYPSPLRDDGYDIADYMSVHPAYGTIRDFRQLVREAHRRGLKVITDLVINHTSDQHPWFQRARKAPPNSPFRNYYVWSDTDERYEGTRIIFCDSEGSNWAWDPVAKAYYWHRFFSHQPDINFYNPRVFVEVTRIMRFWLEMGVDGLRLDAVPYLCEREGTTNENLPETHFVLKRLRQWLDNHYPDRMFLAEANQWPEDVRPYFGDGDECHMACHYQLMLRIYMAIAWEQCHPIVAIIEQTPDIPETCQWAIPLRNRDELILGMLTDLEQDYMYTTYAANPLMRTNRGIRRRLAPLLGNDRRQLELVNVLLFTLPGTPVIYYGDEIGMGDNIYLSGCDGLRTPMQWSPDRNAGFSRCDPSQLYPPLIMNLEYGWATVNVEVRQANTNSLLSWMRRLISLRRNYRAFARGTMQIVKSDNPKILVFLRTYDDETILVVANMSRFSQVVRCHLTEWAGMIPNDILGNIAFPDITDRPYVLNLAPFAYLVFKLEGDPMLFHSCFISYSTADFSFVERLYADLSYKGVKCWFAPEDMKIGDKFRQRIHDSIKTHDKLLLILSVNSMNRTWVEDEVESALEVERKEGRAVLFPVSIDEAVMQSGNAWAESLRNMRHIGDFRFWKEHDNYIKSLARLLRDLKT